ncbi:hypothetical protein [Kangiella marina]|uniref:Uncharacterized protein n=1 Tax=Kangiella marina TaxID=1079178 RepID=A0ABP8IGQ9_9GAMM
MKKVLQAIVLLAVTFGVAYCIGYYVGHKLIPIKHAPKASSEQLETTSSEDNSSLKQALAKEQQKTQLLQKELETKDQQIAQLQQAATESTTATYQEKVIPATDYERGNYVTNLVHFFNSGKNTTQVSDVQCEANSCQLKANISAGANTNPEISQLMKFFDENSKPGLYTRVALGSVEKKQDGSEIVLNLSL